MRLAASPDRRAGSLARLIHGCVGPRKAAWEFGRTMCSSAATEGGTDKLRVLARDELAANHRRGEDAGSFSLVATLFANIVGGIHAMVPTMSMKLPSTSPAMLT